ncbi:immunoglobulin-binding protein 1 [Eucyclogobius newberryi]|uniref:immunoglobulin-binding protein 1 n=1 Tax=Eucyclogobius newberryi TaxID=166745 RepID=UPI003B5D0496
MAKSEQGTKPPQLSSTEPDSVKLSEQFERGWSALEELDKTQEPMGSHSVQERVQRAVRSLESASMRVAQLELFSRNEELEEVCTAELRYLLLPALLGALTLKQTSRERRLEILQTARVYFVDYLQRCKNYNIFQFNMPKTCEETEAESTSSFAPPGQGQPNLVAMAAQRQAKIERYRQKKELEVQLETVKSAVDSGQADEDISRRFYLLHLRRWISLSLEEVESIDQEIPILKNMGVLKSMPPSQSNRPPMKPFILTKDAVQARVFGAGYPSLPTMTVDEWFTEHQKHGVLPDQGIPHRLDVEEDRDPAEVQEEQKERQAENDNEESLHKARSWDDYKDTHRRGYGNRHNMG